MMDTSDLLRKKRDGGEFSKQEISFFIKEMVEGRVTDAQIGAMLMAIYIKGLTDDETVNLTQTMVSSGSRLMWEGTTFDKHSTGGVGDKISIVLAPVLAACGLKVPMISGRSLEFTGGTLDKLESIPGFVVDLTKDAMQKALDSAGFFIAAATAQICPADKMLYKIRDVTSTVDYINLIVSSIISKKVASGVNNLVLDVKVGKAAFCRTVESGRALAKQLICVGEGLGMQTRVVLSRMDEPLGSMVGNTLEITESLECLRGNVNSEIYKLVTVIAANLLEMSGYEGKAEEKVRRVMEDGSAMERFRRMMVAQGVDQQVALQLTKGEAVLPTAKYTTSFLTPSAGWILQVDALAVAKACQVLGAGRQTEKDIIDPVVGAQVSKHIGDAVVKGDKWLTVHHSCPELPADIRGALQQAVVVSSTPVDKPDIIIDIIRANN